MYDFRTDQEVLGNQLGAHSLVYYGHFCVCGGGGCAYVCVSVNIVLADAHVCVVAEGPVLGVFTSYLFLNPNIISSARLPIH